MTADGLSFIDLHSVEVEAGPAVLWTALESYVDATLRRTERSVAPALLGTQPRAGFAAGEKVPGQRLELVGRHRFSQYRLVFEITAAGERTVLSAQTFAAFPGVRGRAYRSLVIGTRLHVLATRHMLRQVRARAERRG